MSERDERRRFPRCSFCGKSEDQVRRLIAGPDVYICDQCIELCAEALRDTNASALPTAVPPRHQASALTARELQFANLYAHGMGVDAISRCVGLAASMVQFHILRVYRKMSTTPNVNTESLDRRHLHDWLTERGLLTDPRESEALLDRAFAALEGLPALPASLSRRDRQRLERRLSKEKALLEAARQAMREPL